MRPRPGPWGPPIVHRLVRWLLPLIHGRTERRVALRPPERQYSESTVAAQAKISRNGGEGKETPITVRERGGVTGGGGWTSFFGFFWGGWPSIPPPHHRPPRV